MGKHRTLSYDDTDSVHKRPLPLLDNQELFGLMTLGVRLLPALEEVLARIQKTPEFLVEMFEFGDSESGSVGKKFSEWFNSPLMGLATVNARIISEIAGSDLFRERARSFLAKDLRTQLSSSEPEKKRDLLMSLLKETKYPEVVFSSHKSGIFSPVVSTLQNIGSIQNHNDLIEAMAGYLEKHAHKELGRPNLFNRSSEYRPVFESLILSFTKYLGADSAKAVSGIISVFDGDVILPYNEDCLSIDKVMLEDQFSINFASKVVAKISAENKLNVQDVAKYLTDIRSLDILSKAFNRRELLKLTPRSIRGQAICDDLGM